MITQVTTCLNPYSNGICSLSRTVNDFSAEAILKS